MSTISHKIVGVVILGVGLSMLGCGTSAHVSIGSLPVRPPLAGPNDSLLSEVLHRAVDTTGKIDLAILRSDSALTRYMSDLAVTKTDGFVSRSAQLAFWINAHNAAMLDLLRLNHPARGVMDVGDLRTAHVVLIGGETFSVSDIERSVIASQFREPRAFFALFLGGHSSPKLLNEPYAEPTLSVQLDRAVQNFLADSTKNHVGKRPPAIYLSEVIRMHADELVQASGSLVAFLRAFASGTLAQFLNAHAIPEIDYLPYDWKQ